VRIVLDTNVFVSGVFFRGKPFEVLQAWSEGRITLVVSPEILDEYRRVGEELSNRYAGIDLAPFLALMATHAEVVDPAPLPAPVCRDPEDDKFLACAIAGRADVIVSGDSDLVDLRRFGAIDVVRPAQLVERLG
jgi:putative PIN family toxin of toxin-antitoxin system